MSETAEHGIVALILSERRIATKKTMSYQNTIIRLANAWPILHMDWLIRQTTKMSP